MILKKLHVKKHHVKSEFLFFVDGECIHVMANFPNIDRNSVPILGRYGFKNHVGKQHSKVYWAWYSLIGRILELIRVNGLPADKKAFSDGIEKQELISEQEQLEAVKLIVENLIDYSFQYYAIKVAYENVKQNTIL